MIFGLKGEHFNRRTAYLKTSKQTQSKAPKRQLALNRRSIPSINER
jgi:hypothetical protein